MPRRRPRGRPECRCADLAENTEAAGVASDGLARLGSPGRTRTSDQSVTPGPPFPAGVDYLITLGCRAACRWRALVGRLFFRHSLVSAPSLRPSLSEGLAQGSRMRAALRLP